MNVQANATDYYRDFLVDLERKSHFNSNLINNTYQEVVHTAENM